MQVTVPESVDMIELLDHEQLETVFSPQELEELLSECERRLDTICEACRDDLRVVIFHYNLEITATDNEEMSLLFMRGGSDLSVYRKDGKTPLHWFQKEYWENFDELRAKARDPGIPLTISFSIVVSRDKISHIVEAKDPY